MRWALHGYTGVSQLIGGAVDTVVDTDWLDRESMGQANAMKKGIHSHEALSFLFSFVHSLAALLELDRARCYNGSRFGSLNE